MTLNAILNPVRAGLLVLGLLANLPAAAADAGAPTSAVKSVVDAILVILRKPDFDIVNDRPAINVEIRRVFDSTAMAQSVLSTGWRDASADQQNEFKELLLETIEGTYLNRIKAYTNEIVEFRSEEIRENRATVNTMIVTASGDVPVNYKLRKRSAGWFVYDVEVENVSMVNSYRDTYRDIVRRDGMEGLLEQMRSKVAQTNI